MTQVHNAFPDKNIYFTEQSINDRTGATNMLPEPMKAPSSMSVGHLLMPS